MILNDIPLLRYAKIFCVISNCNESNGWYFRLRYFLRYLKLYRVNILPPVHLLFLLVASIYSEGISDKNWQSRNLLGNLKIGNLEICMPISKLAISLFVPIFKSQPISTFQSHYSSVLALCILISGGDLQSKASNVEFSLAKATDQLQKNLWFEIDNW